MASSRRRSPGRSRRGGFTERSSWVHSDRLESIDQAKRIAALAQEKLATDIVVLDMRPVCSYTDYFVVATGRNVRQTKAIWDEVHETLKREARLIPRSVDGEREASWIIADYLDVVLHVFTPEQRAFYRLDELWGDVPSVEVEAAAG
jgi:ribosome-associated protein